jgi:hypothetical protein
MASGHVNRTNRPNTWLLRPLCCTREESSCQPGVVHTWPKAAELGDATGRQLSVEHRASADVVTKAALDP